MTLTVSAIQFFSHSNCRDDQDKVVQEKSLYECALEIHDEGQTGFCYDKMLLEKLLHTEGTKIRIICTSARLFSELPVL